MISQKTICLHLPADDSELLAKILFDLAHKAVKGPQHEVWYTHPEVDIELIDFPKYYCPECKEYFNEPESTTISGRIGHIDNWLPDEVDAWCVTCGNRDFEEVE